MAVAGCTKGPQVVRYGGAIEQRFTYVDGEVYSQGDLVRISTTGTIELAGAASAGAVHGMALSAGTTGETTVPVLLFANDTVIAIETIDTKAPEDLVIGLSYTLEVSTGLNGITDTTTNGVAKVVDKPATGKPWAEVTDNAAYDTASDTVNGYVYVSILQSVLDGSVAA
jgi:hypothetical protein